MEELTGPDAEGLSLVLSNIIDAQTRFNDLVQKLGRRIDELSRLQAADHVLLEAVAARLAIGKNTKPD
jgi:hypothetical protein